MLIERPGVRRGAAVCMPGMLMISGVQVPYGGTDAMIEALRGLGRRGVLRALRKADGDTQLAALSALIERVELHGGGRLRVVYRGGAAEPEWVES